MKQRKKIVKTVEKRHGEVVEVSSGLTGGVTIMEGEKRLVFGNDGPSAVAPELRQVGAKCLIETRDGVDYAVPRKGK